MPTARPRHMITETDELAAALDAAAKRWPEERASRRKLLLRLVEEGHHALVDERHRLVERRRAAIRQSGGAFSDVYDDDYLARLRDEWPE